MDGLRARRRDGQRGLLVSHDLVRIAALAITFLAVRSIYLDAIGIISKVVTATSNAHSTDNRTVRPWVTSASIAAAVVALLEAYS